MIVTCERCESRYKIRSDKLPAQGGKIRCPTCRHVFIVRPGQEDAGGGGEVDAPEIATTEAAEEPVEEPAVDDGKETTWKLQVAGLPYSFQGLETLHAWLSARDSLDSIKVAKEGDSWRELGDYPGVLTRELKSKFFPMGDIPTTPGLGGDKGQKASPKKEKSTGRATKSSKPEAPEPAVPPPTATAPIFKAPGAENREARKTRAKLLAAQKAKPAAPKPSFVKTKEPENSGFQMTGRAKTMLAVVLLLLGVTAALQVSGSVDILGIFPGMKPPMDEVPVQKIDANNGAEKPSETEEPVEKKGKGKVILNPEEIEDPPETDPNDPPEPTEEELFAEQLKQGLDFVDNKEWARARFLLEPLLAKQPEHKELLSAMLKVYKGLGLKDQASELKAKLKSLK